MDIRDIERVIDNLHKDHPAFSGSKEQATFELLSSFEDLCSLAVIGSMLNPLALRKINDNMDALNQALQWVEESELPAITGRICINISEERYNQCVSLLMDYAYPYSVICSGYISFSRSRLLANVEGNSVTFNFSEEHNNSTWSDILREASQSPLSSLLTFINPAKIAKANAMLKNSVRIENETLCYDLTSETLDSFLEIANGQWNSTKTLPDSWEFDLFSLDEYRQAWTCIAALCYAHFFSCILIEDPLIRLRNCTIIQPLSNITNYIVSMSGLPQNKVENIIKYITFEPAKHNVDIMYQPLAVLNDDVIITPMLLIGSRPERNLLAVVSSRSDSEHSKEVNDLEKLMVLEIENIIPQTKTLEAVKHKRLGGRLPDIDFALLDLSTNTALLCELKWFAAADSSKEIYAREDEVTHGCNQIESIMAYAMGDRSHFIKQVFDFDNGEDIDLFCCVVAKHNIRTQHKYVPVIDLDKFKELLSNNPINSVFHVIRNHEYEVPLPEDASITHQVIYYGDFTFKIPAICFESFPV
jgi:hypothetical protein